MSKAYISLTFIFIFKGLFAQPLTIEKQYDYIEYDAKNHMILNDETIVFNDSNQTFYHHYTFECCDFKGKGRYFIQDSILTLSYEYFPLDSVVRNMIYVVNDNSGKDSTYLDLTLILREQSSTSFSTPILINDSIFYMDKYGKLKYDLFSKNDTLAIKIKLYQQEKTILLNGVKNKFIYIIADYSNDCKYAVIEYQSKQYKIRKFVENRIIEFVDVNFLNSSSRQDSIVDYYYLTNRIAIKRTKKWGFSIRI